MTNRHDLGASRSSLGRDEIVRYLQRVGTYLDEQRLTGEILIVGGAYMTLVLQQREATRDVDAYFAAQAEAIREAAERAGQDEGLPPDWLNDAVKGFMHATPPLSVWAEFPGLRIYAPDAAYIFAMKVLAGRPQDLRDLEAPRDTLRIASASEALEIVTRYIPSRLLTPRMQYLIEDLFDEGES